MIFLVLHTQVFLITTDVKGYGKLPESLPNLNRECELIRGFAEGIIRGPQDWDPRFPLWTHFLVMEGYGSQVLFCV